MSGLEKSSMHDTIMSDCVCSCSSSPYSSENTSNGNVRQTVIARICHRRTAKTHKQRSRQSSYHVIKQRVIVNIDVDRCSRNTEVVGDWHTYWIAWPGSVRWLCSGSSTCRPPQAEAADQKAYLKPSNKHFNLNFQRSHSLMVWSEVFVNSCTVPD